jgi:hypothetical protein
LFAKKNSVRPGRLLPLRSLVSMSSCLHFVISLNRSTKLISHCADFCCVDYAARVVAWCADVHGVPFNEMSVTIRSAARLYRPGTDLGITRKVPASLWPRSVDDDAAICDCGIASEAPLISFGGWPARPGPVIVSA